MTKLYSKNEESSPKYKNKQESTKKLNISTKNVDLYRITYIKKTIHYEILYNYLVFISFRTYILR